MRTLSKDIKKMYDAIKQSRLSTWLINYSSDVSKGPCANVNGNQCHIRDDESSEKARNFAIFALISGFSAVFPKNSYLSENLMTIFGNIVQQRVSADLSRL